MDQQIPLSGCQVRFIRHHLGLTLRDFAKYMGVTHQSVMRWEKQEHASARMDGHVEFVFRYKVLKSIESKTKVITKTLDRFENVEQFRARSYQQFKPLSVPSCVLEAGRC